MEERMARPPSQGSATLSRLFLVSLVAHAVLAGSASPARTQVLQAHAGRLQRLRGGSGHQGSDPNAKDPSGIWSSFQRIGSDEGGGVGAGLRTVCPVWNQASCKRRSQADMTFRLTNPQAKLANQNASAPPSAAASPDLAYVAVCSGATFCGKAEERHHILCMCEPGETVGPIRVPLALDARAPGILQALANLPPGQYQYKFETTDGAQEELMGMWGVEDHRPLTIMPPAGAEAVLLMSDIDGTLIGDGDATDKFFWIWNEKYRPMGAHLVYNTGRPFGSAYKLVEEGVLQVPTALVCSEGTEIYWFGPLGAQDVEADYEWREILMLSWDYDRIKLALQGIIEMMKHEINGAQFLPDVSGSKSRRQLARVLVYQQMNGQPMIVINVPDKGKADNMIGKIDHELRHSLQLSFDMSCSSGGGNFFILMIPKGASKGSAARHVSKRLGFSPDRVMVAGDGENDVPLFEATIARGADQGFKGAIVGNAVEGLRSWVDRRGSSGAKIHRSMSQQALGVLEGLETHFPPSPPRPTPALGAQASDQAADADAGG